jgi:gas vesicle protein
MKKSIQTGRIVAALLAGTILGAAIGVLFAPHKGKKIRGNLNVKAQDLGIIKKDNMEYTDKQIADALKHHR